MEDINALLNDWLSSGRRSSPRTHEAYRRDVQDFMDYCKKSLKEITGGDVAQYQSYLRHSFSPASEYRKLSALRSFFKYLKLARVIAEDIALLIQTPKVESEFKDKALSVDEIEAIIEAAKPNLADALLLRLLYTTGGRISEVLALTWGDFSPADDGGGYVRILGKGRKNREVYVGAKLWRDLIALRGDIADGDPLFTMDRFEAYAMVERAAKAAKIGRRVSPHQFRHSLASHLLDDGATLAQVRDQLGHSDIKTTSLYLHAKDRSEMIRNLRIK